MAASSSLIGLSGLAVAILKLEIEEKDHVFADSMLESGPGGYSRGFLEAAKRIEDLLISGYSLEAAVKLVARTIPHIEALDVDIHWIHSDVVKVSRDEMIAMASKVVDCSGLDASTPDLIWANRMLSPTAADEEWKQYSLRYVDLMTRVPDFQSMLVAFCTDHIRTQAEVTTLKACVDKVIHKGGVFHVMRPILRPWCDVGLWDAAETLRGYGPGFEADFEKLPGAITPHNLRAIRGKFWKPQDSVLMENSGHISVPINAQPQISFEKHGGDVGSISGNVHCLSIAAFPMHSSTTQAKNGDQSSGVVADVSDHMGKNIGQEIVNVNVYDSDFEEALEVVSIDPNVLSDDELGMENELDRLHGLQHSMCASLLVDNPIVKDTVLVANLDGNGADLPASIVASTHEKEDYICSISPTVLEPSKGVNGPASAPKLGVFDDVRDANMAASKHMKSFLLREGFVLHDQDKVQQHDGKFNSSTVQQGLLPKISNAMDDSVLTSSTHAQDAILGDLANAKDMKQPNAWASKSKKIFQNGGSCGGKLHFIPPNPSLHMKINLDCVRSKFDTWGWSLLGHYVGYAPNHYMLTNIMRSWGVPARYTLEEGWIIFTFTSEADMDGVLMKSPYYVYNKPLIIKRMPDFFAFGREEIATIPVWVRIYGMAKEFWSERLLSEAASYIGTPLFKDQVTELGSKSSYARVMVEVNFAKPITKKIFLDYGNDSRAEVTFIIENEPTFCIECFAFGHESAGCTFMENSKAHKRFIKGSMAAQKPSSTDVDVSTKGTAPKDAAGESGGIPDGVPKVDAPTRDALKGTMVATSVFEKGESSRGAPSKVWRKRTIGNGTHRPNRIQIVGVSAPRVVPRVNSMAPRQVVGPNVNNGKVDARGNVPVKVVENRRSEATQKTTQGRKPVGNSGQNSAEFQAALGAVKHNSAVSLAESGAVDGSSKALAMVPVDTHGMDRMELIVAELLTYSVEERDALAKSYASAKKQQGAIQEKDMYYSVDGNYDPNDPTKFNMVENRMMKPKNPHNASFTHGKRGTQHNHSSIPRGKGKGGGNKPSQ